MKIKSYKCISNQYAFKSLYLFFTGMLLYLLSVLPALIYRGGLFYFYGDYNAQSIEFYTFAHKAFSKGFIFWNPLIEWGGPLVGSLSNYAISPFLLLVLPFPNWTIPYALPFIMSLRYGTAMLTSYILLRTYTKTDRPALLGAMLYTFSGFQTINLVYSIFHDLTAFFPLYLLTFDNLIQKKKKVPFILMTALMCSLSIYFFFGEAIFLIIYYFVRYFIKKPVSRISVKERENKKRTLLERLSFIKNLKTCGKPDTTGKVDHIAGLDLKRKKRNATGLFRALLCGILGVALSSAILVQNLGGLIGNSRINNLIKGNAFLAFNSSTTFWHIVQSIFLVPELMGRQSLFPGAEISWASVSLYLPCVSIAGVIAYFLYNTSWRRDWKIRLTVVMAVIAVIPGFNAVFSALNTQFYARWYYMALLIFCIMTAQSFERVDEKYLKKSSKIVLLITLAIIVFSFLPGQYYPLFNGFLSAPFFTKYYLVIVGATVFGMLCLFYLAFGERKYKAGMLFLNNEALITIVLCVVVTSGLEIFSGCLVYPNDNMENYKSQVLHSSPALDESKFARVDNSGCQNWELMWGYPSVSLFLTSPAPSTFDVCNNLSHGRTQKSSITFQERGIRQILSQKYFLNNLKPLYESDNMLFKNASQSDADESVKESTSDSENALHSIDTSDSENKEESELSGSDSASGSAQSEKLAFPKGYEKTEVENNIEIYENPHFIPMGFTYETYIAEKAFKELKQGDANQFLIGDSLLVKDLILTDDQIQKYGSVLKEDNSTHKTLMTDDEFNAESDARAASACTSFSYDPDGYTAKTNLKKENLVFFSIPWDRGFTAFVDGKKVEIEKVDYGFMAVLVPEGAHTIRFFWRPYGLKAGIIVSCFSLVILCGLIWYNKKKKRIF